MELGVIVMVVFFTVPLLLSAGLALLAYFLFPTAKTGVRRLHRVIVSAIAGGAAAATAFGLVYIGLVMILGGMDATVFVPGVWRTDAQPAVLDAETSEVASFLGLARSA